MDYADVYYVDPRNAVGVNDHRVPSSTQYGGRVPVRPGAMIAAQPATLTPVPPQYSYPASIGPQWGAQQWGAPQWGSSQWGYPQQPPYFIPAPQGIGGMSLGGLGSLVNGMGGVGSLIDMAAQIFTAVMPLPAAPNPATDNDGAANGLNADTNTKNLIIYQSALASYAKRDEQIRTIGSLIKRLVG